MNRDSELHCTVFAGAEITCGNHALRKSLAEITLAEITCGNHACGNHPQKSERFFSRRQDIMGRGGEGKKENSSFLSIHVT